MNALHHALDPAGPQAAQIAGLWWLAVALCAVVFAAVLVALAFALARAARGDETTAPDLGPLERLEHGPRRAVGTSVVATIVLLLVLLVASVVTDRALMRLPLRDALTLQVVAHQWWWEVRYDDPDPSREFTTANEIYVPVGRPVLVRLNSSDVIHSFWVPNLHGKKDLIPGMDATLQFRADRPGVYRGQCAEFCGLQHALMAFTVTAVAPEAFDRWAEAQRRPAAEPAQAPASRGRELFLSGTCSMCHAVQGTPAQARTGPDLTHLASRAMLGAGRLANTPENLAGWITDPQKYKPGVNMPAHALPRPDLEALVAYLETLE